MDKKTATTATASSSVPATNDPSNDVVKALLKLLKDADRQVQSSLELSEEAKRAVANFKSIARDLITRAELTTGLGTRPTRAQRGA